MLLDLSFINKAWVNQQIRLKNLTKEEWKNGLIFLRPMNVFSENNQLNVLGKGILIDPFYNIVHASTPRISVKPRVTEQGFEMFGGVLIRVFILNEKQYFTRISSSEQLVFPTSDMYYKQFLELKEKVKGNPHSLTCLIGLETNQILYTVKSTTQDKIFEFSKTPNVLTCKTELQDSTIQTTLNPNHYITFKLFQNAVYNLNGIYVQKFIKKKYCFVPKKFKTLLWEIHNFHLETGEKINKQIIGDFIMSLSPWKFETLLTS